MNHLTTLALVLMAAFLSSCGDGDCLTCTGESPIFGIEVSSEACENGDGTITVTATAALSGTGLSQFTDTTFVSTLEEFRMENENAGSTCN